MTRLLGRLCGNQEESQTGAGIHMDPQDCRGRRCGNQRGSPHWGGDPQGWRSTLKTAGAESVIIIKEEI